MTDQLDAIKHALADRYTIQRELGSGGMAVVYLSRDEKLHRSVALKVLRPELTASLGTERFLREIEIAAKLRHPNIVALHDYGSTAARHDGSPEFLFYVMPYVEGESLRDRLDREKQLPIDEALQIANEVADALGYAHSLGIVHRDIKPENILFTAGHAVVSDFGIARAVTAAGGEKLTETGITTGTPAYMSPEQASGDKDVDARSDLYSLGCVLYEMLSGDAPYTASTPQAVLAKKQSEPIPRISVVRETVPSGVEATLTRALAKNPADRFVTAQQFVDALAAPSVAITSGTRTTEEGPKRRGWKWGVGVAAVVAIAAVGSVFLDGWRSGVDTAATDEINRLVVAPFEDLTGDSAAADWGFFAAEYVTRALDQAAVVTVVPATVVWDLVRDVDPAVGMSLGEIARRTGADYAVAGSYSGSGGRLRFDTELVNATSGELLQSLPPVQGSFDSLEATLALLAEQVTAATVAMMSPDVGLAFSSRFYSTPPSLDALRALQATQDQFCRFRFEDAIDEARVGLRQTPDYAPLLLMVAISHLNRSRLRQADSVLAIIEPLRNQLTTVERLLADMTHGWVHSDHAEATLAVGELYRIQPSRFGYQACWTLLRTNRLADALERCLAMDLDSPCYRTFQAWWSTTARAYHMLGRYQEELDVARDGLERFPSFRPLMYNEAIALAGLGRLYALDSLLDVISGLPLDPGAMQQTASPMYKPGTQLAFIALELSVLGHEEASKRAMDRALAWFGAQPASEFRFERAQAYYYAERWSDADSLFAALLVGAPNNPNIRGYRAVALVHLGRRDEALEIEGWLKQLDRPYLRGTNTRWRAAIAAALGDREEALRALQQAYSEGMRLGHQHSRDPEWRALRDYGPYQEFVKPK